VYKISGHRMISHGGITGTEYSRFPDDGLTVIILTNLGRRGIATPKVAPPVTNWSHPEDDAFRSN
jgi:hypothetical protein